MALSRTNSMVWICDFRAVLHACNAIYNISKLKRGKKKEHGCQVWFELFDNLDPHLTHLPMHLVACKGDDTAICYEQNKYKW